jgi:hypothetical protein
MRCPLPINLNTSIATTDRLVKTLRPLCAADVQVALCTASIGALHRVRSQPRNWRYKTGAGPAGASGPASGRQRTRRSDSPAERSAQPPQRAFDRLIDDWSAATPQMVRLEPAH